MQHCGGGGGTMCQSESRRVGESEDPLLRRWLLFHWQMGELFFIGNRITLPPMPPLE